MIRLLVFSFIVLFSFIGSGFTQTPVISKSGPYTPLGYCQITSLGTSVSLVTASCSTGSVPLGATIAEICVEVSSVRYRDDGVAPTSSLGILVAPSSSSIPNCFAYAIIPMTAMQLVAVTGSPVVDISFYK